MSCFTDAVSKYGVPDQVRSNLGGENVDVWRYMVEQHSSSSAVLTGSSTHNERIERLWRDVYRCVSVLFHDLFRTMENDENLNCLNEVDMYCLHYAILPRINQALDAFIESWNNHPVSTCQNLTPNQLFVQGAIRQNLTPTLPVSRASYARIPVAGDTVAIPRSSFDPCDDLQEELQQYNKTMWWFGLQGVSASVPYRWLSPSALHWLQLLSTPVTAYNAVSKSPLILYSVNWLWMAHCLYHFWTCHWSVIYRSVYFLNHLVYLKGNTWSNYHLGLKVNMFASGWVNGSCTTLDPSQL